MVMKYLIWFMVVVINFNCLAADSVQRNPFEKTNVQPIIIQDVQPDKITLDVSDAAVREVLKALALHVQKNIIVSALVNNNITLHLQDVTWQQAFDTILFTENLTLHEKNNVLLVTGAEETAVQDINSFQLIKIRYAKATELMELINSNEQNLLSKDGVITADPRTNSIWISDNPQRLTLVRNFIQHLDVPVKQVLIKARIVSVDENCLQELGVKFGTNNQQNSTLMDGLNMDMPLSVNQNGHFNLALAKLGANTVLDLELSALQSEGKGKIISSPELITADRTPAYIEAGEEVPYQEKTASGATNVAFKKAVLSLKVIPQISSKNQVLLNLTVNQDKLSAITVRGVPAIQTREVQTQVSVRNGQTLVLGGIYEQADSNENERIPFLSDIPVLGNFFSNKVNKSERKELLIFVTPQIMD